MTDFATLEREQLEASTTETATGTGGSIPTKTARVIEVWVYVTAISSATVNFVLESSLDGSNWKEVGRISGVTATGVYNAVYNRADNALGRDLRISWEISGAGPSVTFSAEAGRLE